MPTYFVTGATGFIGRHLVERLLARDGEIYVLVRPGSEAKLARLGDSARIHAVTGDLAEPYLGLDAAQRDALRGNVDHFFHLAAIYDMTADETANALHNVAGTQHAIDLANDLEAGIFHHASSIAVAGSYEGHFTEDMFDEGQKLPSAYHRTKFESEKLVRARVDGAWRVYRPSIVVGDSRTGEMDKVDGPYYFFPTMKLLRDRLPAWLPLVGVDLGDTNVVPVDYVAKAMDHLAHLPDRDGEAFHLVNPEPQDTVEMVNAFCTAAGAPRFASADPAPVGSRLGDLRNRGRGKTCRPTS